MFEDVALPKTFLHVQALFKNFNCVFTKEADGSLFDMPSRHPFMPAAPVALYFTNGRLPKKKKKKKKKNRLISMVSCGEKGLLPTNASDRPFFNDT